MKKLPQFIILLAFILSNGVMAQNSKNNSELSEKIAQNGTDSKKIFLDYIATKKGSGAVGRDMIEQAELKGLPKTAEHVNLVRTTLASVITEDEKIAMTRLLASLHSPDDVTGMNKQIESDLRSIIYSNQKGSSRAAVLAFARTGYYKDSQAVLSHAKLNGMINKDEYYGELSHILSFAPESDQLAIVSEIKSGKNRYATEILTAFTPSTAVGNKLYPETQSALLQLFLENEPIMPMAIGEIGYVDVIRYANWLHAVALLNNKTSGGKYEDYVLKRLNDNTIDPRKIMAFLVSDEGKSMIQRVGKKSLFDLAIQRIALYSKQLPGSYIMIDFVKEIKQSVSTLKG